ncbi:hypothetical protein PG985_004921 [Apiospora marii]|uniref:uncharacterized protein n=1 Tax=Apiospora marii TaxID=335849 RepID=UPI00312CF8DA
MLPALAKKATECFSPKAAKEISTTTHVSLVLPSIPQTPTPATGPNLTEPSSCTDARHAAVAMDLRLSPNAPLFPADWLQGCREIQDNLKQVADAFLPQAYLPKEKFNEVAPPQLPSWPTRPRRRRRAWAAPPRGARRDGARDQPRRAGRRAGTHGLCQAQQHRRAGRCRVDDDSNPQERG